LKLRAKNQETKRFLIQLEEYNFGDETKILRKKGISAMIFFAKSSKVKEFVGKGKQDANTQGYLMRLITAFLLHVGRMSASRAASSIRTQARHRANVTRFLARSGFSRDWMQLYWMAVLVLEQETERTGRWLFILDQTFCSQQGKQTENTYSMGNRTRRPRKGRRYGRKTAPRSVHAFVMGLLITPGGLRLPVSKDYFTKDYCLAKQRTYRKQTELAADLIDELQVPAGACVTVLGDTAFEAAVIRAACARRGCTWIVPINPERVLAGVKPRPKVRSLVSAMTATDFVPVRLDPQQGSFVKQRRVSRCRLGPKMKIRTFHVHSETREVHSVGKVQLVFSCKEAPIKDKPIALSKILMTNDTTLTAALVVEMYSVRWQIELFFKELKSTLGFHQYRFRKYEKVAAWVQAALLAFLYLEWVRGRTLREPGLNSKKRDWWQSQRTYGIAGAVRQQAEEKELLELHRLTRTKTGLKQLKKTLRDALPTEYRIPA
jgi:hypothetical protein